MSAMLDLTHSNLVPSMDGEPDRFGGGQKRVDTQKSSAPASFSPAETKEITATKCPPSRLENLVLLILADALDDLERTRIATENRVRSLSQVKEMTDTPEKQRLQAIVLALAGLEHEAELELKRALRKHPLGPWMKRTIGIGEKQGARLLAAIGDPATRVMPSQLWAYCGLHVLHPSQESADAQDITAGMEQFDHVGGVAPRRQRGVKSNWNDIARMRVRLVAESCVKRIGGSVPITKGPRADTMRLNARSPYRDIYDQGRVKYADSVHNYPCNRCGPAGKPAPVSSPLNPGHQHARAIRLVMKAILLDLWKEAKALEAAA